MLHGAWLTRRCTTALQHDKTGLTCLGEDVMCLFLKGIFLLEVSAERVRKKSRKGYEHQFMRCIREQINPI